MSIKDSIHFEYYIDIESSDLYKASQADLIKACCHANRQLHRHKLYLDQLLAILIDKHPEVLGLVAEAQIRRFVILKLREINGT